jgi:hypothetical protein
MTGSGERAAEHLPRYGLAPRDKIKRLEELSDRLAEQQT